MSEWRLYPPLLSFWRARGYHAAASVTDPRAKRVELDVVAFTRDLSDVRVTEAKARATGALLTQCVARFAYAPRVYAAVPAREADRLVARAAGGDAADLGLLAIAESGAVQVLREATPRPERVVTSRAHTLERALETLVVEGKA